MRASYALCHEFPYFFLFIQPGVHAQWAAACFADVFLF